MQTGNIFVALAILLYRFNQSLESSAKEGGLPRWVRIARAREYKDATIGKVAFKAVTSGLLPGVAYMHRFALQAYDILQQADSLKALGEVTGSVVKEIVSETFVNTLTSAVGADPVKVPAEIGKAIDIALKLLNCIPEPDSLNVIGHEIYKMLCIVHNDKGIDIQNTGKLRLLQWGFGTPVPLFYSNASGGFEKVEGDVCYFGIRKGSLESANTALSGTFNNPKSKDSLVLYNLKDGEAKDSTELKSLMKKLGYNSPDMQGCIKGFQKINNLSTDSGDLDDITINRLMNLDMEEELEIPDIAKIIKGLKMDDPNTVDEGTENKSTVAEAGKQDIKKIPKIKVKGTIKKAKLNGS
jgi:hypothetical protein